MNTTTYRHLYKLKLVLLLLTVLLYLFGELLVFPDGNVLKKGKQPIPAEKVKLDWYMDSSRIPVDEWQTNPLLKEISRKTGIEPELRIPLKNKTEKIDLMIASDNFPDILTLDMDNTYIYKLLRMKKIKSLDELSEQYEPGFREEIGKELRQDITYDDGKLYGLPGSYIPRELYRQKEGMGVYAYTVRKDIYLSLGSPDMGTPEKFKAALRLFKQKYPVIAGKPSIPVALFGFEEDQLLILERSFGISEYCSDKYGNLEIRYKNPAYPDLVRFLNSLYREGLMSPFAFIKQREQVKDDLEQGRVFCIPAAVQSLEEINTERSNRQAGSEYLAIEPMKAVPDVSFPGRNRYGTTMTMIPAAAKRPKEAVRLVRYLWGNEANNLLKQGHEGIESSVFPVLMVPREKRDFTTEVQGDTLKNRQMADRFFDNTITYFQGMNPDYGLPIGRIKSKLEDIMIKDFPVAVMAGSEDISLATFKSMLLKLEQTGLKKLELYWTERHRLNQ